MPLATLLLQSSQLPWSEAYRLPSEITWRMFFELGLIGVVVYAVLRFLQGTRGARLMLAVMVLLLGMLVLWIFARLFAFDHILVLYPYFVGGTFLIALVVFQPELRRGLTRIGEQFSRSARTAQSSYMIESIVNMATNLSRRKIGALVAIERRVPVGALRETGVALDAEISRELLETIFWPGSTLHDLGVIITEGRIAAAGCEFPLAEADPQHRIIGSRHRAGLGMSLETDALVIIVSEETGSISLAVRGVLHRDLDGDKLREMLVARLIGAFADESEESLENAGDSEANEDDTVADDEDEPEPKRLQVDEPMEAPVLDMTSSSDLLAESKPGA